MNTATLVAGTLTRELRSLRRELEAYERETDIWRLAPGISNSAGTLTLHLVGNLRHFVGVRLGGTKYVRNRDAEFAEREISRAELLARLDVTIREVDEVLSRVTNAQLAETFPDPIGSVRVMTEDFMIHLAVHCGYHVGQVDYHRRLITGSATTVGAVAPAELRSAKPAQ